jgi:hypothetical protein
VLAVLLCEEEEEEEEEEKYTEVHINVLQVPDTFDYHLLEEGGGGTLSTFEIAVQLTGQLLKLDWYGM